MKVQYLSKENLKAIIAEVEKALSDVKIEGVSIKVGNCSFDMATATIKVTVTSENGKKDQLAQTVSLYGIASIEKDGHELIEYRPRLSLPFIYKTPDGKLMKTSLNGAMKIFGSTQKATQVS